MTREHEVRAKFEVLAPLLNERLTRLWAAAEADVLGLGGIAIVERATGLSRTTIRVGRDELRDGATPEDVVRVRRAGGGRWSAARSVRRNRFWSHHPRGAVRSGRS